MNQVVLTGRLVKDPEIRYTSGTQMAVATFTIAVDRPTKAGEEKKADFPRVTVFGKQAENCERFTCKGKRVAILGRLQTGTYDHNGETRYTTDVVADRVEFIDWKEKDGQSGDFEPPAGFSSIDEDIPFA